MGEKGVVSELSGSVSEHQLPMLLPSKIASDFVGQYYHLLRTAPQLLYRFYTHQSTCTHGDMEAVVGKSKIHSLFQRNNYRECRTTIQHFDTHGTLTDGVIVLVTGEQSNAGLPERPFVQTFVLASQTPRRYYVLNDIFRYVDEIIGRTEVTDVECQTSLQHISSGDQECSNAQHMRDAEEKKAEREIVRNNTEPQSKTDTSSACSTTSEFGRIPMPRWATTSHRYTEVKGKSCPKLGNEHNNDGKSDSTPSCRSLTAQTLTPELDLEGGATKINYESRSLHSEQVKRVPTSVSSGRGSRHHEVSLPGIHPQSQSQSHPHPHPPPQRDRRNEEPNESRRHGIHNNRYRTTMTTSNPSFVRHETVNKSKMPQTGGNDRIYPVPHPSQSATPVQRTSNQNVRRHDRRRPNNSNKYADNQQLFLGQIPHNATEEELVSIFSRFGNVLELRVLPNLGGRLQPGAKYPLKYGFLTFETVASVKACLESRPVFFPENSPSGQKLNVRAKKPCHRNNASSSCQTLGNLSSMRGDWSRTSNTNRRNTAGSTSTLVQNGNNASGSNVLTRKDKSSSERGTQHQSGKKYGPTPRNRASVSNTCNRR